MTTSLMVPAPRIARVLAFLITIALASGAIPAPSVTSAATHTFVLGVDVSHHQGTIDWNRVAESGHVFAFHKATEGATFTDDTHATNRSGAAAVGIPFGAYHFARPDGATIAEARADAVLEAQHFLSVAQPAPGDLIPVLDMEATGGLPVQRLTAWTQAWLDSVTSSLDVRPLIYTSPNFWRTNLADTTTFAEQGFPLWIAHYTSAAAPTVPAANWNGQGWAFWQWTSCATVPGISGCADEDRFSGLDLSPYTIPGAPQPEPSPEPATAPSNTAPPSVSGETEVGHTLIASSGSWTGSRPLSYSYSWFRCDTAGSSCSAVLDGTEPTYELVQADHQHRMRVTVTATNSAGSSSADSSPTEVVTDTTAPTAPLVTKPRRQRTLSESMRVAWTEPERGVAGYDVRYRRAPKSGAFAEHEMLGVSVTQRSTRLRGIRGSTYCFSVRARDQAGNTSGWSPERCTLLPLDDRDLRSSSGWARRSGTGYYRGTFMKTKRRGSTLVARNVALRKIHLVGQRCPDCGKVKVLLNGSRVKTIDLESRRLRRRVIVRVASFGSIRRGDVEVVVVSTGAPVKIDGLALSIIP